MRACKLCGGSAYVPYVDGCAHDFGTEANAAYDSSGRLVALEAIKAGHVVTAVEPSLLPPRDLAPLGDPVEDIRKVAAELPPLTPYTMHRKPPLGVKLPPKPSTCGCLRPGCTGCRMGAGMVVVDDALELMVPMGTPRSVCCPECCLVGAHNMACSRRNSPPSPITAGAMTRAEWRTYLGRSDTADYVACAHCGKTADRVPLRMDGVQLATHPEGWTWVQGEDHRECDRACSDACAGVLTHMVEEEAAARDRAAAHWAEWKRKRGYTP